MNTIRIATRRSPLALAQAEMVAAALKRHAPHCEVSLMPMSTSGDREQHKDLSQWGYKGLFTKELEEALLEGRADIAVHSMKDMPSLLPEGLVIAGMLPRDDPRDAFIALHYPNVQALPHGATVGCSSIRRTAALKRLRPDLKIIPFRGNVGTRLDKLRNGEASATLLAVAGLNRLGLQQHITDIFPVETMLPAVAQGAIGMEVREADDWMLPYVTAISDDATMIAVSAERALLQVLDGSCRTPLGGYATLEGDRLHLRAQLLSPDGAQSWEVEEHGQVADAIAIGQSAGAQLKGQSELA
jgi:hydroxymethylbilane synthase